MEKELLLELLQEKQKRLEENKLFFQYFQEGSSTSIDHYAKHYKFIADGLDCNQRLFEAANRIGKTELAGFEITCHAIGWYPSWWPGKRYPEGKNLLIWAAGDTNKNIRDIFQVKLLGGISLSQAGTGIIPKKYIEKITRSGGVSDLVDTIFIKRIGGGTTTIQLKSYAGGRETFQGTEVDIIWLDEEPPQDVYVECQLRTLTNNGIVLMTFTPLRGRTPLINDFHKNAQEQPNDYKVTKAAWDDVPHLTEEAKARFLAGIPEWQRDARTKGIPQLGSGAIYRVSPDYVFIDPIQIPDHWRKAYALDVGWRVTAAVWGALDPDTGITYIYSEMYEKEKQAHEYARIIKGRGDWIEGVVDSASNSANQHDGVKIYELLKDEGLKLSFPDKAVTAGIIKVWELLSTGKLKIFNTCANIKDEYTYYRRDEKGNIVKENDHTMDALRYLIMSGMDKAKSLKEIEMNKSRQYVRPKTANGWMG